MNNLEEQSTIREQQQRLTCRKVLQDFVHIVLGLIGGCLTPVTTAQNTSPVAACPQNEQCILRMAACAVVYQACSSSCVRALSQQSAPHRKPCFCKGLRAVLSTSSTNAAIACKHPHINLRTQTGNKGTTRLAGSLSDLRIEHTPTRLTPSAL